MSQPDFDVASFLAEPRRPASVATVTQRGDPAPATMWFAFAEGRLWFHTSSRSRIPSPFLAAAARGREIAVMIATFDPPHDVRQIRVTGPARIEPTDPDRVKAVHRRYVDDWTQAWERQATSADYHLWSLLPQRGMAVAYPGLSAGTECRWTRAADMPGRTEAPEPGGRRLRPSPHAQRACASAPTLTSPPVPVGDR